MNSTLVTGIVELFAIMLDLNFKEFPLFQKNVGAVVALWYTEFLLKYKEKKMKTKTKRISVCY